MKRKYYPFILLVLFNLFGLRYDFIIGVVSGAGISFIPFTLYSHSSVQGCVEAI